MTGTPSLSALDRPVDDRDAKKRLTSIDAPVHARRAATNVTAEDLALVKQLLAGEEAAFTFLIEQYHGRLHRLAMTFIANRAAVEDVVQDTWLAVLKGLHAFEGRSSLKAWIFAILTNLAKTRAVREKRWIGFSEQSGPTTDDEPVVAPDRFTVGGAWSVPPQRWHDDTPETLLLRRETRALVEKTIAELPWRQRAVVTLRDVEGLDAGEVCDILEVSDAHQRVLLHRARSKVRSVLERHLARDQDPLCCPPAPRSQSPEHACSL